MNTLSEKMDTILQPYLEAIGSDIGYINHTKRMMEYALELEELNEEEKKKFLIALAFHDLGIWTEKSFDYLEPSIILAQDYLKENNLLHYEKDVIQMIDEHHKLRAIKDNPLAELFRKVDIVDVYFGFFSFGIKRKKIKKIKKKYPNNGFHKTLIKWFFRHIKKEPLRPMPMLKW